MNEFSLWMERLWDRDGIGMVLIQYRSNESWVLTKNGEWRQHEAFASVTSPDDLPTFEIPGRAVKAFCQGVVDFMERNSLKVPDAPVNATLREERDWLRGHIDTLVKTAVSAKGDADGR